jgi:hypothetical protein
MKLYEGLAAAADAVREFYYTNKSELPPFIADRLKSAVGTGYSPVDLVVTFTELAYANREAFPKEGLEIAAGCAQIIHQHGFHSDLNGRTMGIQGALRRDSGERAPNGSGGWPDKAKDPAPADGYAIPAEEEAGKEE